MRNSCGRWLGCREREGATVRMNRGDVTALLVRAEGGDRAALDELIEAVYGELRRLAAGHLRRERQRPHAERDRPGPRSLAQAGGSPGPALAEPRAFLRRRVARDAPHPGRSRPRARRRQAPRRSRQPDGGRGRAQFDPSFHELITIDTALDDLSHVNARLVRVVECRYFGGLTIPETAEALGVSHTTVSEDWRFARAWLHRALTGPAEHPEPKAEGGA